MARRAILAASSQAWRSLQACSASAIGDVIGRVGISTSAGASRHHQQQKQQHAPPLPPLPGAEHDGSGCNPTGPAAFVFDIDGVLIRGRHVLPAAKKAMQLLTRAGEWTAPVVFLTNGGGVSEAHKARELSEWLGAPVRADQVILSHTPLRALAPRLGRDPVVVSGRKDSVEVALSYGFTKVLSTHHLAAALPDALPFGAAPPPDARLAAQLAAAVAAGSSSSSSSISSSSSSSSGGSGAATRAACPVRDLGWATDADPVRAVLVFCDPDGPAWYQELQLLHDVITSHGSLLRTVDAPAPGSRPVEVVISNPDLLWVNEHARPRFGQGAFAAALDALHRQTVGTPLAARFLGKPNPEPYRLAEALLVRQAVDLGLAAPLAAPDALGSPAAAAAGGAAAAGAAAAAAGGGGNIAGAEQQQQQQGQQQQPQQEQGLDAWEAALIAGAPASPPLPRAAAVFSAIYAVGDNPAADARGANAAGAPWASVLVRTGVFRGGHNSPTDPARIVVDDVLGAVQAALHRARGARFHSMR